MGIEEELQFLQQNVRFEEDEQFLAAQFGQVTGPGIDDREGILFVTDYRVGISVAPGIFSGAAAWSIGLAAVKQVQHGKWGITVDCKEQAGKGWITRQIKVGTLAGEFDDDILQQNQEVHTMLLHLGYRVPRFEVYPIIEEGWAAEEAGNYAAALNCAVKALQTQPDLIQALALKSDASENLGNIPTAISCMKQIMELGPDDPGLVQTEIARLLWATDQHQEAAEAATVAIKSWEVPDAYIWRSLAYSGLEETTAAISDIKRAVQVAPESPIAWRMLGLFGVDVENTSDIQRAIKEMKRLGDEEQYICACEAALHRIGGRHQKAYEIASAFLAKDLSSVAVATEFLRAAAEVDRPGGLERLPHMDEIHGEDSDYQLWSSILLLSDGRAGDAYRRYHAFHEKRTAPGFEWVDAYFLTAALFEEGKHDELIQLARPYADSDDWISSEALRATQGSFAYFLGRSLLEKGQPKEALPYLQMAEGVPEEEMLWTAEELKGFIEQAHQQVGIGAISQTMEAVGHKPGTYEILGMVLAEFEKSGRLAPLERKARELYDRFDQPPLLAVMGEYSVGKSTFINAWVERDLLPTGEGVTTGTITWLRYGEQERMRVVMMDGRVRELPSLQSIDQAVRETGTEAEIRQIRHVEVFLNAPVLRLINIVDSPGLNAPFPEHQKLTEQFLAKADGILFLFNVEAAGKSTEASFLSKLQQHQRKAVGVVSQIDLVPYDEAVEVVEGVEGDFPGCFTKVLGVSGKLALDGALKADDTLLKRSRMPQLRSWLDDNLLDQARELKAEAARTKVRELLNEVTRAREEFEQVAAADTQRVVTMRKEIVKWFNDELAAVVTGRLAKVKNRTDNDLQGIAIKIAERSTNQGLLDMASINGLAQGFHRECVASWKEYSESLQKMYLERIKPIQESFDEIEGDEWRGILDASLVELRIEIESWRKDLVDYIEQVEHFSAGFIDAQGIATNLHLNIPVDASTNSAAIAKQMRGRVTYVTDRAQMAAERWRNELITNFNGSLGKLERKMRVETARVRDEGYLRLERLSAAL